jgi:hypothetical protein
VYVVVNDTEPDTTDDVSLFTNPEYVTDPAVVTVDAADPYATD